jgi:hypothetical protein
MATRTYSLVTPPELRAFSGNPNYEKNLAKAGVYLDQTQCCCVCGKRAKGGLGVYLSNVGEYITEAEFLAFEIECEARNACSDDLGVYPVGADCARKLRACGVPIVPCERGLPTL